MFNRVVRFILENLGKNFSAKTIFDFFKSPYRSIAIETIYNYLSWLEEAFIIYRNKRFFTAKRSRLTECEAAELPSFFTITVIFFNRFNFEFFKTRRTVEKVIDF